MIIKENIFSKKSEDDIVNIFMKQYYGKFFIKKVNIKIKKIFLVTDIFREEDFSAYYIELKVLANAGIWIATPNKEINSFHAASFRIYHL